MAAILGVQLIGQAAVLTVNVNPAGLLEVRMGNNPLALLPVDAARWNHAANILTIALVPGDLAFPELYFQIRDQDGVSAPPARLQLAHPIGGGPQVINMGPPGAPPNFVVLGQGGGQAGDPQAYQLAQAALNQLGGVANAALQHGQGQAQAVGNPADPQAFLGIVGNLLATMRNEAQHWINLVGQQLGLGGHGGHGQGGGQAQAVGGNAGQNNVVVPVAPPNATFTTRGEKWLVVTLTVCVAIISGLVVWLLARNSEPAPAPPVVSLIKTTAETEKEDDRAHCAIVRVTVCADDPTSSACLAALSNCQE